MYQDRVEIAEEIGAKRTFVDGHLTHPDSAAELAVRKPGSGVGSPAEALELAPETLAGSALPTHGHDVWPGLRRDRRAVVHVTGRGDDGSHTRLDGPHDLDDTLATPDAGLNSIACANLR